MVRSGRVDVQLLSVLRRQIDALLSSPRPPTAQHTLILFTSDVENWIHYTPREAPATLATPAGMKARCKIPKTHPHPLNWGQINRYPIQWRTAFFIFRFWEKVNIECCRHCSTEDTRIALLIKKVPIQRKLP